jgi:glycosyltransferase involved in cell wall biosynthesis
MSAPMKLAYVMSHRELNGVASSGTAQIRELLARGHEVHLVHRPGAWIGAQDFHGNIHRHAVDMGRRWPDRRVLDPVRRALNEAGCDVAYTQGTQANGVGVLWRWQGFCPVVAKAAARIWHPHWRFQDGVIAPSQYTVDWFLSRRLVNPARIHVVPSFVRAEDVIRRTPETRAAARAELGLAEGDFAVAIIGKLGPRKNQAAIVPILQGLRGRGVEARAMLFGGGSRSYTDDLRAQIAGAGLVDRIALMGHRNDARDLLPAFDALLCTSHDEQAPVVLVEAMAAGVPCVSTPVGMAPDMIVPGETGMILDLKAPGPAIDYLAHLARTPEDVTRHGAAARTIYDARLTAGRVMDRMEEVFRQVIAAAR